MKCYIYKKNDGEFLIYIPKTEFDRILNRG